MTTIMKRLNLRAAAIALMLLSATTAWAEKVNVKYIDADTKVVQSEVQVYIVIGYGEATGIDRTVLPPGGSQPPVWQGASGHDLQGRRIAQPTRKGIYIRNGKKIIIK